MTEQMRRLILLIGAVLLVVLIIVGVWYFLRGSGSKKETQKIQLNYWGLWEPNPVLEGIIADYEAQNPNIDIIYTRKSFAHTDPDLVYSGAYQGSVLEQLKSPSGADIVRIHNSWTSTMKYYLSPLPTSIMTPEEYKQTFYPIAYNDFTDSTGKIYAIPLEVDGLVLFYNKDIFKQAGITSPPSNWDQVVQVSQKLRTLSASGQVEAGGIGLGAGSNVSHSFEILMMMFTQANVQILSNQNEMTFDTDRGAQVVKYYLNFATTNKVWSYRLRSDLSTFIEGKLAMMIAPSWRTFDIRDANQKLNFGIATLPVLPGANSDTPQYYATYWGEAVSRNSKNPTEAWKFVKYLSEQEQMRKMYTEQAKVRDFGEPYSRIDLANELRDAPYAGVVIRMAPTMKSWAYGDILDWEKNWRNLLIQKETAANPSVTVQDLIQVKSELQKGRDDYTKQLQQEKLIPATQ